MSLENNNFSGFSRIETKVPLQRFQYQEYKATLIRNGLYPKGSYPDRTVHSIYLDTPSYNDYLDNVSGISKRKKVRFRWYNEDVKHIKIEVKSKCNKSSTKLVTELENSKHLIPRDRRILQMLFEDNEEEMSKVILQFQLPVLEVSYWRRYFTLTEGIRMTVDSGIKYRKLWPLFTGKIWRSPVDYVIEFKYEIGLKQELHHLLRELPFRAFRHSKYIVGMDSTVVG